MSMTTKSDHDIITTCLNLSHLTTNSGIAVVKKKAVKRTVFLYEEAKEEDWEQFRVELDRILKNKKALGLCKKQIIHRNEQDHLDEIWGIIERAIIEAANKSLPKKKVSNFRHTKTKEFNRTYMHRPILQISRWMRFIRDRLGLPIEETDKLEFNLTIEKINTDLQLEIQQAKDIWTEDTLVDLKGWWKIMKERNSKEIENATNKEISRRIKEWCEMISSNQGKMIASLLDKPYRKVKLDKLLEKEGLYTRLISNPEQVLDKTRAHFQDQFRQRRTNLSEEYQDWQEVYEPKTTIKEEWYKGMDEEILEEEWLDMLKKLKGKSAPGQSGITYTLIRAASSAAHKVFRKFLSLCFHLGKVPKKWKLASIYLIPKEKEWNYSLANVRPIALLETFRKCMTKIYTDRFARVMINKNILRGPNFAGLPGNSTESPIHVLNAILEDAHWEKKELWILFCSSFIIGN